MCGRVCFVICTHDEYVADDGVDSNLRVIDYMPVPASDSEHICMNVHVLSAYTCMNVALLIAALLFAYSSWRLTQQTSVDK